MWAGWQSVGWFTHNWLNKHTPQSRLVSKCQLLVRSQLALSSSQSCPVFLYRFGYKRGRIVDQMYVTTKPGMTVKTSNYRIRILKPAVLPRSASLVGVLCPDGRKGCAHRVQCCTYHTCGGLSGAAHPKGNFTDSRQSDQEMWLETSVTKGRCAI